MVFVVVEIEQADLGDIITRLLGAKHKITVVEELATACGCQAEVKRRRLDVPTPSSSAGSSSQFQSQCVSSSKFVTHTDINSLVVRPEGRGSASPKIELVNIGDDDEDDDSLHEYPNPHSALIGMIDTAQQNTKYETGEQQQQRRLLEELAQSSSKKRNNGVPYNSGAIYNSNRRMVGQAESEEDEEAAGKDEFVEGIDMAVKCKLCDRTIALGTRPANHSTRKYAHARCHGFKERFQCSICHGVFKNKRVTFNHNRTAHDEDPNFRIIDNWNEEAQRELVCMVKKCFPKTNKPFIKGSRDSGTPATDEGDPSTLGGLYIESILRAVKDETDVHD